MRRMFSYIFFWVRLADRRALRNEYIRNDERIGLLQTRMYEVLQDHLEDIPAKEADRIEAWLGDTQSLKKRNEDILRQLHGKKEHLV